MDTALVVSLVKAGLGISSTIRDEYITAIAGGVLKELEDEKGLVLDGANSYHLMFVVDYAAWRYQNRNNSGAMPRDLQYRLNNLYVHTGGAT